jgi:hypothetical protein
MFMVYPRSKFHAPSFTGSIVIAIKPKGKQQISHGRHVIIADRGTYWQNVHTEFRTNRSNAFKK